MNHVYLAAKCAGLLILLAVCSSPRPTQAASGAASSWAVLWAVPPHAIELTLEASKAESPLASAGSASAGAPEAPHSRTVLTVTIANRGDVRAGIFEPICFEGNEEVAPHPSDQVKLKTKPLTVEI